MRRWDSREKKTVCAAERDEAWRAQFADDLTVVDPDDLVYLDERGFQTNMTRSQARCPLGQRAVDSIPRNRGRNLTLLCGLTSRGPVADMVIEGGVGGDVFVEYVRQVLVPLLREGQVVVLDNLGAHHRPEVRTLVEGTGALLVYLPPYSPDLNPIELMFSKVNAAMRAVGVRTRERVLDALSWALGTVTSNDVAGWYSAVRSLQLIR